MWDDLYEAHYRELVAYGIHMSGSKELSEDLAQETFVRAMIHSSIMEDLTKSKQRAWLYRTFKNLFYDRCRHSVLENEYVQNLAPENMVEQGIEEVENALLLQSISPEDRQMFSLRYEEGYTAREISEMLGIPPGTVRSRLSRCRQKLRETIDL